MILARSRKPAHFNVQARVPVPCRTIKGDGLERFSHRSPCPRVGAMVDGRMATVGLREKNPGLYFGDDVRARKFRYGLICFDAGHHRRVPHLAARWPSAMDDRPRSRPRHPAVDRVPGAPVGATQTSCAICSVSRRRLDPIVIASLLLPVFSRTSRSFGSPGPAPAAFLPPAPRSAARPREWFRQGFTRTLIQLDDKSRRVLSSIVTSVVYVTHSTTSIRTSPVTSMRLYFTITYAHDDGLRRHNLEGARATSLRRDHHGRRRSPFPCACCKPSSGPTRSV